MSSQTFIINLPKPCSQDWEQMTPVDKGRFCGACRKTVIDFSVLSDKEVVNFLKTYKSTELCGHVNHNQVGREYAEQPIPYSLPSAFIKKVAASFLFLQSVTNIAWSQAVKPKTHHQQKVPIRHSDDRPGIRGYLKDYLTQRPLAQMTVTIAGTDIKTTTDASGYFYLPFAEVGPEEMTITAGYNDQSGPMPEETVIKNGKVARLPLGLTNDLLLYRYPCNKREEQVEVYNNPHISLVHLGG